MPAGAEAHGERDKALRHDMQEIRQAHSFPHATWPWKERRGLRLHDKGHGRIPVRGDVPSLWQDSDILLGGVRAAHQPRLN